MKGLIDTHSHILPGVDDGPESLDDAIRMVQMAKADGISSIVLTPHIMEDLYPNNTKVIREAFDLLKDVVEGVSLYMGAEIRINRDTLEKVINGDYPTINGTGYLLIEFPTYSLPPLESLLEMIGQFLLRGFRPVVAHPERNVILVENQEIMKRLLQYGVYFQITTTGITRTSKHLRKRLLRLIEEGYIHLVGSDSHDTVLRPPILSGAYRLIERELGEVEAERLFIENPLRLLRGEELKDP